MAPRSIHFASFTLDLDRLCLHTPAGEIKLRPKTFEVLRYLVENPQRVVTKEEVIASIWSGVTVNEEALTRCISELRRALGDEAQQIVKTAPKRGYLLDVPTTPEPELAPAGAKAESGIAPPGRAEAALPPGSAAPASAALPEPTARVGVPPERRLLTVLVCELMGLKALAARLDLEDLREVVGAFDRCIAQVVEHHGGYVAPRTADGARAYFGYPHAHEDDAERAVRAALAATRAVGELTLKGLPQGIQTRIGIASGLVLAVEAGRSAEPDLVGETPLVAAHLASLAAPGGVVMSGATRRIVGSLFESRDLDAAELKGAEPVDAAVVLNEGAVTSRFEALRGSKASSLVGRDEELGLLLRRWEQAKSGNGRLVLLTGDGGIGKSRIALAVRERLARERHILVTYQCSPFHQTTALHPIITQLSRAAGIRSHDSPEARLGKLEATLAQSGTWTPEQVALLAALLSIPGGDRYRLPDLDPQQLRERTFAVLREYLLRLCGELPVLIICEDLHWIDPTTLDRLSQTVEEITRLPVLLVATARPEFSPPWPNHWHTSTLPLSRLPPPDIEALIGGLTDGMPLPAEVVAEIITRTDGIPLFIEELTKSVLESGMVHKVDRRYELTGTLPPRAIPSSLYASLAARLDRQPAVKDIAQIGATIGVEFAYAVIAAVANLPEPLLRTGLAQLVAAELIFERGAPPDASYRFKHTLVRDAAYESMVRPRREALHGEIARAIEERTPATAATAPGMLAHHYEQAGLLDKAAAHMIRGGRLSLQRSATMEAIAQLEKALSLLAVLPPSAERGKQEVDTRLMLFQAYLTLGRIDEMTETLVTAVDLARRLGDERKLALVTSQLATAQWMRGKHAEAAQSAQFVLDYAGQTEKLDPARGAEILQLRIFGKCTLANAVHGQGRIGEAITLHREIIDTLVGLKLETQRFGWAGLPSVISRAFLGWFLAETGDFEAARKQIVRGCVVADAALQPDSQVLIHAADGLYHLRRGYPELAVPILGPTLRICQRVPTMEAIVAGWLGTALVETERATEALAVTVDAFRRRAHLAGGKYTWFYLFKAIGEAHAALGHVTDAMSWADRAIQVTEAAGECLHTAQGLKSRGDIQLALSLPREAAIADLEAARQIAEARGLRPLVAECDLSLAQAWAGAGRSDEARRLAARAGEAFRALGLDRRLAEAERVAR
ncbi:MAG TPA: AAA family ATPase [Hyphomicrobiaceae bacterium]|nr:AAA family ATPase [Hyphomicrobiaceae bacterium]